jgi:hypothetical protein
LANEVITAIAMIAPIPNVITSEIFIKQRYNSGLNSDRILAPAITK